VKALRIIHDICCNVVNIFKSEQSFPNISSLDDDLPAGNQSPEAKTKAIGLTV